MGAWLVASWPWRQRSIRYRVRARVLFVRDGPWVCGDRKDSEEGHPTLPTSLLRQSPSGEGLRVVDLCQSKDSGTGRR